MLGASLVPLALLFAMQTVSQLDREAFALLLPEIRDSFGLSLQPSIVSITVAGLVLPMFALVPARFGDRFGHMRFVLGATAAIAIFCVGTGLASTVALLTVSRTGANFGRDVVGPLRAALLSDYYPPRARARVMASVPVATTLGRIAAPPGLRFVATGVGWRPTFALAAVPLAALVVASAAVLREPTARGVRVAGSGLRLGDAVRALTRTTTLRRLWLAYPFLAAPPVVVRIASYLTPFAHPGRPGAEDWLPAIVTLVVGSVILDRVLTRDAARTVRALGWIAGVGSALVIALALVPTAYPFLIPGVFGVESFLGLAVVTLVSLVAPPDARALAFAVLSVTGAVGGFAVDLLFGFGPDVALLGEARDAQVGMLIAGALVVIGALLLASAHRSVHADMQRASAD